jgi:hypothetical protein
MNAAEEKLTGITLTDEYIVVYLTMGRFPGAGF